MKREMIPYTPEDWSATKLKGYLNRFKNRKILVIGDVGVDRYTIGTVERISPEAPVPIVRVEEERHKLGLATNVADNISALGGTPRICGIVGADRHAEALRGLLKRAKISVDDLVVDPERRTVLKERVVSDRQQLLRIDYESTTDVTNEIREKLFRKISKIVPFCDAVIVEDYAKGLLDRKLLHRIFLLARKHKKLLAVDPNVKTPMSYYMGATLLTPNTKEAEALAGSRIKDMDSLFDVGSRILRMTGAAHVIITRGKDGMAIFSQSNKKVHLIPTYARDVYDVSGAGDTVIATLTLALASGASVSEAAVLGNLAAGVEVGKRGTATVTPEEVLEALHAYAK